MKGPELVDSPSFFNLTGSKCGLILINLKDLFKNYKLWWWFNAKSYLKLRLYNDFVFIFDINAEEFLFWLKCHFYFINHSMLGIRKNHFITILKPYVIIQIYIAHVHTVHVNACHSLNIRYGSKWDRRYDHAIVQGKRLTVPVVRLSRQLLKSAANVLLLSRRQEWM